MNETKPRLAIVITHPIRYVVPLIQLLASRNNITIKVFYTYGPELLKEKKYDPAYRQKHEYAVPVYEGYDYEFIENVASQKSTFRFRGINNPSLIHKINDWRPDFILVYGWRHRSHLQVMRHFKGKIPVHFRGDSTLLDEGNYNILQRTLRHLALKYIYRHIDKAWYVGEQNRRYFLKMGVKGTKLEHVPHAVDNERFRKTTEMAAQALNSRASLKIPPDATVFLYAGKIKKEKGVFVLLQAFQRMNSRQCHLLFVGDGKDLPLLKKMTEQATNIHFLSAQPQTNMPFVYSMADVCVLPSASDTWGLVLNEAMANGMAVIASDKCGSAIDLVSPGVNGFIFPAGDITALVQLMETISRDASLLKKMKEQSVVKISAFSYEVLVSKIEAIVSRS